MQKFSLRILAVCVKEVQALKFGEEGGQDMMVSRLYSVLQLKCCDSVRFRKECNYRENLKSHETSVSLCSLRT